MKGGVVDILNLRKPTNLITQLIPHLAAQVHSNHLFIVLDWLSDYGWKAELMHSLDHVVAKRACQNADVNTG